MCRTTLCWILFLAVVLTEIDHVSVYCFAFFLNGSFESEDFESEVSRKRLIGVVELGLVYMRYDTTQCKISDQVGPRTDEFVTAIRTDADGIGDMMTSMLDFRYWRCVMKREWKCPDSEINFFLYTPERPFKQWIDVRYPKLLDVYGWDPDRKNVLIIHGFNGTAFKTPMSFIRDAYISRKDYNVFMVDWSQLTRFPCYLSSLSNLKLAAQCTAQLYSYITKAGALAKMTTCVGHSLGAHVCGMISNHLTEKQHKIIGLDPARPLVSQYGSRQYRLGRDDAHVVQVIHTNAGFLGESGLVGHADFCVNGGKTQPGCKGHFMRIARCSHFMSACYFAGAVRKRVKMIGIPCDTSCPKNPSHWGIRLDKKAVMLGNEVPDRSQGMYCVTLDHQEDCPFD